VTGPFGVIPTDFFIVLTVLKNQSKSDISICKAQYITFPEAVQQFFACNSISDPFTHRNFNVN